YDRDRARTAIAASSQLGAGRWSRRPGRPAPGAGRTNTAKWRWSALTASGFAAPHPPRVRGFYKRAPWRRAPAFTRSPPPWHRKCIALRRTAVRNPLDGHALARTGTRARRIGT